MVVIAQRVVTSALVISVFKMTLPLLYLFMCCTAFYRPKKKKGKKNNFIRICLSGNEIKSLHVFPYSRSYVIDAVTQCGTVQCMQYVIEAIRDYDQVQPEDVTALLSGMSAVRKPSPMLFVEVLVSMYFCV